MGMMRKFVSAVYALASATCFPMRTHTISKRNAVRKTISILPATNPSYGLSLNQTSPAHNNGSTFLGTCTQPGSVTQSTGRSSLHPCPCRSGTRCRLRHRGALLRYLRDEGQRRCCELPPLATIAVPLVQGPLDPVRGCFSATACGE